MKKSHGMMFPRTKRTAASTCKCTKCGKELTPAQAYYYVDGCNCAITQSAQPYCIYCYRQTFKGR